MSMVSLFLSGALLFTSLSFCPNVVAVLHWRSLLPRQPQINRDKQEACDSLVSCGASPTWCASAFIVVTEKGFAFVCPIIYICLGLDASDNETTNVVYRELLLM
jgi:hypothetical protein